jgi:hypothetical protein
MEVYTVHDNPQELGLLGRLPNEIMEMVWAQVGRTKFPFHARHLPPSHEELRTEATTQYRNQISSCWPALHPAHVGVVLREFRLVLRGTLPAPITRVLWLFVYVIAYARFGFIGSD